MTKPNRIEPTEELVSKLLLSQFENLKEHVDWGIEQLKKGKSAFSDDGYDYITASLELTNRLCGMYYEDLEALDQLINTPPDHNDLDYEHLDNYACDGIASAFYDLNCIAMYNPEDDQTTSSQL